MIIRGWNKLIEAPSNGKSGKREIALTAAIFTAALTLWTWGDLSGDQKAELVSWLWTISAALIVAAYGLQAAFSQMGFHWNPVTKSAREDGAPRDPEPNLAPDDPPPSIEDMKRDPDRPRELE